MHFYLTCLSEGESTATLRKKHMPVQQSCMRACMGFSNKSGAAWLLVYVRDCSYARRLTVQIPAETFLSQDNAQRHSKREV